MEKKTQKNAVGSEALPISDGMKEGFFSERGLYYRTNEFREGRRTLLFMHGLSGSSSAWKEYEKHFEHEYNVIAFDLRGHGKSQKHAKYADYEIRHFADDLDLLLHHLDISEFILISHSFAALIALEYLARYKDRARAAVFLSPHFAPGKELSGKLISVLLPLTRSFELFPFKKKTAGHIDYAKYPNSGDWNIKRMLADVPNTGLRVYLYCTRQSLKVDHEKTLAHITIPVLLMHGKNDTIFPFRNSEIMARHIKNSKLILLEHTDHIIVLNRHKEVIAAIEEFLAGFH